MLAAFFRRLRAAKTSELCQRVVWAIRKQASQCQQATGDVLKPLSHNYTVESRSLFITEASANAKMSAPSGWSTWVHQHQLSCDRAMEWWYYFTDEIMKAPHCCWRDASSYFWHLWLSRLKSAIYWNIITIQMDFSWNKTMCFKVRCS